MTKIELTLLIGGFLFHAVVFVLAMCHQARRGDEAMDAFFAQRRDGKGKL